MAHKSKTQRAKAAAAKANKKERQQREEAVEVTKTVEDTVEDKKSSKSLFKKKEEKTETKPEPSTSSKKEEKPKKTRFKFIKDVRAELKRVTWPTRTDVLRWSGVVVVALLFFGIFTAVLDNLIITPGLVALSSLGNLG